MFKEKIILTNSVGKDDLGYYIIHSPSRWSEGVRLKSSWFAYYPWELAYTSSLLKQETPHAIKLIDPCLKRWDKYQTLAKILDQKPDWLIIESSTRTIQENLWVGKNLKKKLPVKVVFVGQHASVFPNELIKEGVDYVCIGEFELTLLELFQNKDKNTILGLYPNQRRPLLDFSRLPFPEDIDIKRIDYATPGEPSSEYIEIQAYASRGCRGNCNFCVSRNIYYAQGNWRPRNVNNIINEIKYLKNKYPQMEGIFFDEETHNGDKDFIKELASKLKEENLSNLKYEAMCDIRILDKDILTIMKEAGYYKIRFGIETASLPLSKKIGKPMETDRILDLLKHAKNIGLKMYATFMFGLPEATPAEDSQTINFMKRLIKERLIANAQISTATPFPGTPFYSWVKKNGYLANNDSHSFDGANSVIVNYPQYNKDNIENIKNTALIIRDHLFLKTSLTKNPLKFLFSRYKKYGLKLLLEKLKRRFKTELQYLKLKTIIAFIFLFSLNSTVFAEQIIQLPHSRYQGKISIEEALYKRKSIRKYSREPLNISELSQLLWSASDLTIDRVTLATRTYSASGG
ncbi:MAG: radical SAM protein [Candidatus Saelkia tenebricola]|nr:radical SAM protein [Candidatus Saelkia tenebricola]